MTNLLQKFNISGDVFSTIADAPEVFESTGRTNTLHLNRRVAFKGSINGVEVPAYATLREAYLSRMSVIHQSSPNTNNEYDIVTGIFKPVKIDIEVMIDGELMTLPELLRAFVNASTDKPVDEQTFLDTASKIGLKFVDGMPLLWQQFGASEDGIAHAFKAFADAGAVDVLGDMNKEKTNNITKAYAHPTGVPVTSFEVGTVNRQASRTGQGFLNLVDASVDQFQRIVNFRKQAAVLKNELAMQTNWSQKKVLAAEDRIKVLNDMSRQWTTNWAGAQQIIKIDEGGEKVPQNQYAAVNAPCGRFTMISNGQAINIDLWKNSARAENINATTAPSVVASDASDGEELPF